MRGLLTLFALLLALPASARIKIDRYEAATLPEVRLWVTALDGDEPATAETIKGWTVYADGEPLADDADWQTAGDLGRPMAVAAVVDARYEQAFADALDALQPLLGGLPDGSKAVAVAASEEPEAVPEEAWTNSPDELMATLRSTVKPGAARHSATALSILTALERFPLPPDVDPEPDEDAPKDDPKDPVPLDRVLVVVSDGLIGRLGKRSTETTVQQLVQLARRRRVRIMTLGVGERAKALWTLKVLARKTGGTYRRAHNSEALNDRSKETAEELAGRFVINVPIPELKRGDDITLMVQLHRPGDDEGTISRDFTTRAGNVLTWWERTVDWISDKWEQWPWWVRTLIVGVLVLIVAIIVLVILVRRSRKAKKARAAQTKARQSALAQRKPCPICGQVCLPDWANCMFCGADMTGKGQPLVVQQEASARFRLTGRAGDLASTVARFDDDMITLGTAPECEVRLTGREVSAHHCAIRDRGDEFLLIDLNSATGTFVNNERIQQAQLHEGDVIRVAAHEFVFGVET
jgi:hypothetical protein